MDGFMRWEERRWTWEGLQLRYCPRCCKLPRLATFYWSLTFLKIFFKPNWGNKRYSFSGVNFIATDIHWWKAVISSTTGLKKWRYVRIYIKMRTQIENFSQVAKTMPETNEFFPGLFQSYTFIEVKIIILCLGLSFYFWKNEKVKAPFNILSTT